MQVVPFVFFGLLMLVAVLGSVKLLSGSNGGVRKRELVAAHRTIAEIENLANDQLMIDPNDLTAHNVLRVIRTNRQRELS